MVHPKRKYASSKSYTKTYPTKPRVTKRPQASFITIKKLIHSHSHSHSCPLHFHWHRKQKVHRAFVCTNGFVHTKFCPKSQTNRRRHQTFCNKVMERQKVPLFVNNNDAGKNYSSTNDLNDTSRYVNLRHKALEAMRNRKVFMAYGRDAHDIRQALLARGWVEKLPPYHLTTKFGSKSSMKKDMDRALLSSFLDKYSPNFVWGGKLAKDLPHVDDVSEKSNPMKSDDEHVIKSRLKVKVKHWSSKVGLCESLKDTSWHYIENVAEIDAPRTYSNTSTDDLRDFINDYYLTACTSLLRWILVNVQYDQPVFSFNGEVSVNVMVFALNRCKEFLYIKENKDIDGAKPRAITTGQWNCFLIKYRSLITGEALFKMDMNMNIPLLITFAKYLLKNLMRYRPQLKCEGCCNVWIVKPSYLSMGLGIKLSDEINQILNWITKTTHQYVVQKYIEEPLLIYETKFDLRQYFLVTNVYPLEIWMYKDCFLKFCSQKYTLDSLHESIHLTNQAVQRKYENCPTRNPGLPKKNISGLHTFKKYLKKIGKEKVWDNVIYPGMKKIIIGTMLTSQECLSHESNRFGFYGCDFILDNDFKPWLIEINSAPDLTPSYEAKICNHVLVDIIKVVIDHAENPFASTGNFECVYRQPTTPLRTTQNATKKLEVKGSAVPLYKYNRKNPKDQPNSTFIKNTESVFDLEAIEEDNDFNDFVNHVTEDLNDTRTRIADGYKIYVEPDTKSGINEELDTEEIVDVTTELEEIKRNKKRALKKNKLEAASELRRKVDPKPKIKELKLKVVKEPKPKASAHDKFKPIKEFKQKTTLNLRQKTVIKPKVNTNLKKALQKYVLEDITKYPLKTMVEALLKQIIEVEIEPPANIQPKCPKELDQAGLNFKRTVVVETEPFVEDSSIAITEPNLRTVDIKQTGKKYSRTLMEPNLYKITTVNKNSDRNCIDITNTTQNNLGQSDNIFWIWCDEDNVKRKSWVEQIQHKVIPKTNIDVLYSNSKTDTCVSEISNITLTEEKTLSSITLTESNTNCDWNNIINSNRDEESATDISHKESKGTLTKGDNITFCPESGNFSSIVYSEGNTMVVSGTDDRSYINTKKDDMSDVLDVTNVIKNYFDEIMQNFNAVMSGFKATVEQNTDKTRTKTENKGFIIGNDPLQTVKNMINTAVRESDSDHLNLDSNKVTVTQVPAAINIKAKNNFDLVLRAGNEMNSPDKSSNSMTVIQIKDHPKTDRTEDTTELIKETNSVKEISNNEIRLIFKSEIVRQAYSKLNLLTKINDIPKYKVNSDVKRISCVTHTDEEEIIDTFDSFNQEKGKNVHTMTEPEKINPRQNKKIGHTDKESSTIKSNSNNFEELVIAKDQRANYVDKCTLKPDEKDKYMIQTELTNMSESLYDGDHLHVNSESQASRRKRNCMIAKCI